MDSKDLSTPCTLDTWPQWLSEQAQHIGFCAIGFTPAGPLERDNQALQTWLAEGYHGTMGYMAKHGRRDVPHKLLPQVQSIVALAMAYDRHTPDRPKGPPGNPLPIYGQVASYARGEDYHQVLHGRLQQLSQAFQQAYPGQIYLRPAVDTAPLLERGYAARSGIGFLAKSTLLIVPGVGSDVVLAELLLSIALPHTLLASPPQEKRGCGQCVACLQACPTQAFVQPHILDARRCISYLTLEHREAIPRPLRSAIGDWLAGCDICQTCCPYNQSSRPRSVPQQLKAQQQRTWLDCIELLTMGSGAYRRLVRNNALARIPRWQLARNAAVVLGNSGQPLAIGALQQALMEHPHVLVRGHAAWALGQFPQIASQQALHRAAQQEQDPSVLQEIQWAQQTQTYLVSSRAHSSSC